MIDGHLPYDVLLDADISAQRLAKYRLLVLPNIKYLSQSQIGTIEEYVFKGVELIATDQSAAYDKQGKKRPQCGLAEVCGPIENLAGSEMNRYGAGSCLYIPEVPRDE